MKPIIGILGPTAVGKSKLALALAKDIKTEIISADSMQIYKNFDIGTAKPTKEEQASVKHHLIDIVDPTESFSSYLFKRQAQEKLKYFQSQNMVPLIVGGTGFFFKNLLYQFDFEEGDEIQPVRQRLEELKNQHGNDFLYQLLTKEDADSAAIIHPNDSKKVMRALEIFYTTGKKKSSGENLQKPLYPYILFVLNKDREQLYQDINDRVDIMIKNGLIDEVQKLYSKLPSDSQSMQAIGYKELVPYLKGEEPLDKAVELIKQHSRNYAKRQITFYKKMDVIWLDANNTVENLISQIKTHYFNKFAIEI